jgi:hypothetical protein
MFLTCDSNGANSIVQLVLKSSKISHEIAIASLGKVWRSLIGLQPLVSEPLP